MRDVDYFSENFFDEVGVVVFEKRDGTIRHMICTINPDSPALEYEDYISSKLDSYYHSYYNQKQDWVNDNLLLVYDLEYEGLRTIRIDSIIKAYEIDPDFFFDNGNISTKNYHRRYVKA